MKKVGFILEIEGTKDTVDQLAKLELELANITKRIREAKSAGDEDVYANLRQEQLRLQEASKLLRKEFREQVRDFNEIQYPEDSIIGLRNRYRQLKKELETVSTTDPKFEQKALEAAKLSDQLNEANKSIGNFTSNIGRYEESFQNVIDGVSAGFSGNIGGIAAAFGAGGAIVAGLDALAEGVQIVHDLTQEFVQLRGEVQQLTGATGDDLDRFATGISAIANTFNKDYNEVLIAANTLTDQLTGDFDESLRLIEQGFLSGADANGEFLDSLREYPTFFKEARLSGEQLINVITQSTEQGIFSDKGVDAIKEATLRLRELPQSTKDALDAIGFESEEIIRLIDDEGVGGAIQAISERLGTLRDDSPEVGQALADIFGGAGEDAGLEFIKTLKDIDVSIENNIDSSNALVQQQQELLRVNREFADAQNELAKELGSVDGSLQSVGTQIKTTLLSGLVDAIKYIKELGSNIAPAVELVNRLSRAFGGFKSSSDEAGESFNVLAGIAKVARVPFDSLLKGIEAGSKAIGFFADKYNQFLDFLGIGKQSESSATLDQINSDIELIGSNAEQSGESYSRFVNRVEEDTTKAERSIESLRKEQESLKKQIQDASLNGQNYDGLLDRYNELEEEIQKVNSVFDDNTEKLKKNATAAEKLADTSLAFLNKRVQEIRVQLEQAPSENTGLIASLRDQLKQAEQDARDAQIALGILKEAVAQPLQTIETESTFLSRQVNEQVNTIFNQQQQAEELGGDETLRTASEFENEKETQDAILEYKKFIADQEKELQAQTEEEKAQARQRELEAEQQFQDELTAISIQAQSQLGESIAELFSGQISTFKDFSKQVIGIALDAVQKSILAYLAQAQAGVIASNSAIPVVGLAKGIAESAIVAGLINGFFNVVKSRISSLYTGGYADIPVLGDGRINHTSNINRRRGGDNVLAYVKTGELILNQVQQTRLKHLFGDEVFKQIGVPGFANGGFVGANINPQLVNPSAITSSITNQNIDTDLNISDAQLERLAKYVALATKQGTEQGTMRGLINVNRENEKQELLNNQLES